MVARDAQPLCSRPGYTLIELLVVVTVMGIAASMVVPAFSQTNTLRLQGAVRMIVADLTQAQSDAVAMQSAQGVRFSVVDGKSSYVIAPVSGNDLDTSPDIAATRVISGDEFGQARLMNLTLSDGCVYFDELGGPVTTAGGHIPAGEQYVDVAAGRQIYRVLIEAFTGRVTVREAELTDENPGSNP